MCYVATQVSKAQDLQSFYAASLSAELTPEYESIYYKADGFTHPKLMILLNQGDGKVIDLFQWGLIPNWKKPLVDMIKLSKNTLNAKRETLREKPSFKTSIINKRCIIPVNSFFEYKHVKEGKTKEIMPYLIHPVKQPFFNLAGIYSNYFNPESKAWIKSFAIITEPANTFMADIHNRNENEKRMPLILSNDMTSTWLDSDASEALINELMQYVCDDSDLSAYRVRRDLKAAGNDSSVLRQLIG